MTPESINNFLFYAGGFLAGIVTTIAAFKIFIDIALEKRKVDRRYKRDELL